jgi:hypothetical protein
MKELLGSALFLLRFSFLWILLISSIHKHDRHYFVFIVSRDAAVIGRLKAEIDLKSAAGTAEASSAAEKISVTGSNHPLCFAGPTRIFRY